MLNVIAGYDPRDWVSLPSSGVDFLAGQPAASVPCGWTTDGLPVGLQMVGRLRDDGTVLRASAAFEQLMPWATRRPTVETARTPPPGEQTTEADTPSAF